MTTECDAIRAEVVLLADENRRLLNEILELRKAPAYPEAAVRAAWTAGVKTGYASAEFPGPTRRYEHHAEEIAQIFTEALKDGGW
jgi:hypothetical protein